MHFDSDHAAALEPFVADGWITESLYEVKSGKEATVFCCEGGPRAETPLVAAKIYRPIESRRFKNDGLYVDGRLHMARAGRAKRAVGRKSSFGRQVQYGTWLAQEWDVLRVLHQAGVAVPRPIAMGERAILMPFLGDRSGAAPMLHEIDVPRETAATIVDELLLNVELMLDHDCVHGDLSPYNVMWHEGKVVIIDFPQAVDPRLNHNGRFLLARDIDHICRWAARHGVSRPAERILTRLWTQFTLGELG